MEGQTSAIELQTALLKHQIELEESNYRYAVELQKDLNILSRMRNHIQELRDLLKSLQHEDPII